MNIENPGRVFDLSYVPPRKKGKNKKPPELVFTTTFNHGQKTEECIFESRIFERVSPEIYLKTKTHWSGQQADLFPEVHGRGFGFGGCGYVVEAEDFREYHLPLTPTTVYHVALTVHVFSMALDWVTTDEMKAENKSNRFQLLTFETWCVANRQAGWGHAVHGSVFPAFRRWLTLTAEKMDENSSISEAEATMRTVYNYLGHPLGMGFNDQCRARLYTDGRFILECPGDACDVAIYPDSDYGAESDIPTPFSCHNLDHAWQQLILLSGLAVLHELAVKDLG